MQLLNHLHRMHSSCIQRVYSDRDCSEGCRMPSPLENGAAASGPHAAIWLTEPSAPAVEMGHLAGYDPVVLDIEHGYFDLRELDTTIPFIRAKGMRVIAKVLGPERGPIQQ